MWIFPATRIHRGRTTRSLYALSVVSLVLLAGACDDSTSPERSDPVVGLTVVPDTVRLPSGSVFDLKAEFVHESGDMSEAVGVVWTSLEASIAVVDSTGRVEAIGSGRTRVVATVEGLTDDAVVNVPGWFSLAPLPEPRRLGHAAALGGRIYYIGGNAGLSSLDYVATTFVLDPESESWSTGPAMPTGRDAGATAVADGSLYVIGGINPDAPNNGFNRLSDNEVFRSSAAVWETLSPMPTSRGAALAGALDGRVYVIGGNDGPDVLNTVEIYDPSADSWSAGSSLPLPRQGFAIARFGDAIYTAGGEDVNRVASSVLAIFEGEQGAWRSGPPMPSARAFVAGAALQGKFVVLGGWSDRGTALPLDRVEAFDPATETWSEWPSMPVGRREASAVALDGILYVMGGVTAADMTDRVDGFIP